QYGDKVVCTITNHRLPQVKLAKTLDPTTDPGTRSEERRVGKETNGGAGYGNNGKKGFVDVSTGTHLIGEAANSNSPTALTDYDSSVSCDNGDHNTAPAGGSGLTTSALQYGDKVVCTITNHRLPQVKLAKTLDPTTDPGT